MGGLIVENNRSIQPFIWVVAVAVFVAISGCLFCESAQAASVICAKKKNSKIVVREGKCLKKEIRLVTTAELTGPAGPAGSDGAEGPAGEDGQLRIYGDGSAGALNVASNGALYTDYAADGNLQFTSCSIAAGFTLTVPSGTVFRCSGTFTIDGTLEVWENSGSGGAGYFGISVTGSSLYGGPAVSWAGAQAGAARVGDNATYIAYGGLGAQGVLQALAYSIRIPGVIGGGGGAGSNNAYGGDGGGTVTILAKEGISINSAGKIEAKGAAAAGTGSAGGGGGIVSLASPGPLVNEGAIDVSGGNGGNTSDVEAAGGGGGGGIVVAISPSLTFPSGGVTKDGGAAGANGVAATQATHLGGGGGGSCGGAGGHGGNVNINGTFSNAAAGGAGHLVTISADPTALF